MKKILFFILTLASLLIVTACVNTDSAQTNKNGSTIPTAIEIEETFVVAVENDAIYVADATMYRGTVTNIAQTASGTVLTLAQAIGTNFGAKTMTFLISAMTTGDTDITDGTYVEVFYGRPMRGEFDYTATQDAIGINNLGAANMVNFNGSVLSIQKDGETITNLTMHDMQNGEEVIFNVSSDTQMYLAASDLKQGDALNIYHRGMYTLSLPPQSFAVEIQYMAKNSEGAD